MDLNLIAAIGGVCSAVLLLVLVVKVHRIEKALESLQDSKQ